MIHLGEIGAPLWPALAGAHRFDLSARNVAAYIAEHHVDLALANWLKTAGSITSAADSTTPLGPLALDLLNATTLDDDVTLQLVDGLRLEPGSILAASLQKTAHTVLPALVQKRLVLDDADAYTSLGDDESAIKHELILISKTFPDYMIDVALSTDDLSWIASGAAPDAVKEALLADLETFTSELGPETTVALANWAAAQDRSPTADTIVTLAINGGSKGVRPILELLGAQATTIDLEALKSALNALGEPYSQLTTTGWERPKVALLDGVAAVLARLQQAGIVSKFEESTKKCVFQVSKRHS